MNSAKRLKSSLDKAFVFEYISLLVYVTYTIFDKFSLRDRVDLSLVVGDNVASILNNYFAPFWGVPLVIYILFFFYKCCVTIKVHNIAIDFADSSLGIPSGEKLSYFLTYSKYLYSIYVTVFILMFLLQHVVFIVIYTLFTLFYVYTWLIARDYTKKIRYAELGSLVA